VTEDEDVADEAAESLYYAPQSQEEEESEGMKADELKEYLRRLNPEDFGRFTP
jgi:hypothetical protein